MATASVKKLLGVVELWGVPFVVNQGGSCLKDEARHRKADVDVLAHGQKQQRNPILISRAGIRPIPNAVGNVGNSGFSPEQCSPKILRWSIEVSANAKHLIKFAQ